MGFEEIDIRKTPAAVEKLIALGVMATPALIIGERVLVGFDRVRIDEAIAAL